MLDLNRWSLGLRGAAGAAGLPARFMRNLWILFEFSCSARDLAQAGSSLRLCLFCELGLRNFLLLHGSGRTGWDHSRETCQSDL
ncbi:hypothetical protein PoB_001593800 [Plakobranchus ocellatus]|uniref:Secreted protein n=1 Tax=Plakobranchus ocellatus TaxID=259542 RepID=A0AAV3Z3W4_9GAST|nr:hypothetical protein PoB_001593800 [Plakobranchus ocellatus]